MADFDAEDKDSWYIGMMSREEANSVLQMDHDGVFLVRDSTTIKGDFVLCVKEENKVSHYIINRSNANGMVRFKIGEQEFSSLPALLNFYKTHYLDTTSLIKPARRLKYVAKFRFAGKDPDDLPFERGEILTLIRKDEEQWWTAMNAHGQKGSVPVPYIEKLDDDMTTLVNPAPVNFSPHTVNPVRQTQRQLPCWARVIKPRVPNAYDKTQLKLTLNEDILVHKTHDNGQWEGELKDGTKGSFPFTHVRFIDELEDSH